MYDSTTVRLYDRTTVRPYDHTTIQPYKVLLLTCVVNCTAGMPMPRLCPVVQWSVHWALSRMTQVPVLARVRCFALVTCGKKKCELRFQAWPNLYIISINNGNRTEWSPIWSVIIRTYVMSMITDRIVRHEVLLPINHDHYNFQKKKIHLGQTSPVGTMFKATNLEISQFFFSE